MQVNVLSGSVIAQNVWQYGDRSLTNIGAMGKLSNINQSIPPATILDMRPSQVNQNRQLWGGVNAGAAGATQTGYYDGTTFVVGSNVAAAGTAIFQGAGANSSVGFALKNNDAVNSATFAYAGWDWND